MLNTHEPQLFTPMRSHNFEYSTSSVSNQSPPLSGLRNSDYPVLPTNHSPTNTMDEASMIKMEYHVEDGKYHHGHNVLNNDDNKFCHLSDDKYVVGHMSPDKYENDLMHEANKHNNVVLDHYGSTSLGMGKDGGVKSEPGSNNTAYVTLPPFLN